ncbi:CobW family GTP-binding protein [Thiofilum flexile]|uniref:CobW family GTP-binding protein n=1 Tax=Thiofilum flexile TaxID=125627 RepID=UPI00036FAF29|nr:GTP-binding protein [Thiofilum flexile]
MTTPTKPRIPVLLLTGFLGSGKTTLLNHLLQSDTVQQEPVALLINEFGSVGLDQQLVGAADLPMALLAGGCVCCAMQNTLLPTLKNLWMERNSGKFKPYQRIIIETTGLADPTSILATFVQAKWAADRHYVDGVITTVDAVLGMQQLDEHFEAVQQVTRADKLLITKADLVDSQPLALLTQRLHALNPLALIEIVEHGQIAATQLFNLRQTQASLISAFNPQSFQPLQTGASTLPLASNQVGSKVDKQIHSFALQFEQPVDLERVKLGLSVVMGFCDTHLLRMKAVLQTTQYSTPVVLQAVQHLLFPEQVLEQWPSEDRVSRVVFITAGLEVSTMESVLDEFRAIVATPTT